MDELKEKESRNLRKAVLEVAEKKGKYEERVEDVRDQCQDQLWEAIDTIADAHEVL